MPRHRPSVERSARRVAHQLDDRAQDNWEPLLTVADVAGGDWRVRARDVARLLSAGRDESGELELLLHDVQAIFATNEPYVDGWP
jgi:putative DNA primase/helicase